MKKIVPLLLVTLTIFPITGCNSNEYTSFKEYTEIVKNANEKDKNIFVFSSTSCAHCQKIMPSLEKYKIENEDVSIYSINVDYWNTITGKYIFKDKTMGNLSGSSVDDCMKRLDNRIGLYIQETKTKIDVDGLIFESTASKNYSYCMTPLIIWYEGNIEVKISNNVIKNLTIDDSNNVDYESFVKFMEYPEVKPSWNIAFDLNPYEK